MKNSTPHTGIVALAVVMGVALTACSTPKKESKTPTRTQDIKTLQFVNPLPDTNVWKQISDCMGEQAEAQGIDYTESGPPASKPADATVMIQQIQDAVAAGRDAIVTFPASGAFGPVLKQAQNSGALTATLYGDGSPESGATVNAGVDWGVIGKKYVDAIAALPGKHVVGLVAEAPTGVGKSWIDGVRKAAENTDNVTVVGEVYIGADASKALPEVTSLLTAHPDIDIVASNTGIMTQGAVAAIKSRGLKDRVHLLVINNANGGPEAVRDGYAIGVYLQDLCDLAKRTVDGVVQASRGKEVPLIEVADVIATKDNLQEYLNKGWN
ncbi:sugar ABC transporter substrate-binding protein [Micromonospora sp. B11E3]|uniref:sugar ABC transporter substrate-binding protein n=1 Tax=Micromonospora sp. B11E3 TaxID=3153562 RepID=UPI00325F1D4E